MLETLIQHQHSLFDKAVRPMNGRQSLSRPGSQSRTILACWSCNEQRRPDQMHSHLALLILHTGAMGAGARLGEHQEGVPQAGHSIRAQARDGLPGGQPLQEPPEQGAGTHGTKVGCTCRSGGRVQAGPHCGFPQPQVRLPLMHSVLDSRYEADL